MKAVPKWWLCVCPSVLLTVLVLDVYAYIAVQEPQMTDMSVPRICDDSVMGRTHPVLSLKDTVLERDKHSAVNMSTSGFDTVVQAMCAINGVHSLLFSVAVQNVHCNTRETNLEYILSDPKRMGGCSVQVIIGDPCANIPDQFAAVQAVLITAEVTHSTIDILEVVLAPNTTACSLGKGEACCVTRSGKEIPVMVQVRVINVTSTSVSVVIVPTERKGVKKPMVLSGPATHVLFDSVKVYTLMRDYTATNTHDTFGCMRIVSTAPVLRTFGAALSSADATWELTHQAMFALRNSELYKEVFGLSTYESGALELRVSLSLRNGGVFGIEDVRLDMVTRTTTGYTAAYCLYVPYPMAINIEVTNSSMWLLKRIECRVTSTRITAGFKFGSNTGVIRIDYGSLMLFHTTRVVIERFPSASWESIHTFVGNTIDVARGSQLKFVNSTLLEIEGSTPLFYRRYLSVPRAFTLEKGGHFILSSSGVEGSLTPQQPTNYFIRTSGIWVDDDVSVKNNFTSRCNSMEDGNHVKLQHFSDEGSGLFRGKLDIVPDDNGIGTCLDMPPRQETPVAAGRFFCDANIECFGPSTKTTNLSLSLCECVCEPNGSDSSAMMESSSHNEGAGCFSGYVPWDSAFTGESIQLDWWKMQLTRSPSGSQTSTNTQMSSASLSLTGSSTQKWVDTRSHTLKASESGIITGTVSRFPMPSSTISVAKGTSSESIESNSAGISPTVSPGSLGSTTLTAGGTRTETIAHRTRSVSSYPSGSQTSTNTQMSSASLSLTGSSTHKSVDTRSHTLKASESGIITGTVSRFPTPSSTISVAKGTSSESMKSNSAGISPTVSPGSLTSETLMTKRESLSWTAASKSTTSPSTATKDIRDTPQDSPTRTVESMVSRTSTIEKSLSTVSLSWNQSSSVIVSPTLSAPVVRTDNATIFAAIKQIRNDGKDIAGKCVSQTVVIVARLTLGSDGSIEGNATRNKTQLQTERLCATISIASCHGKMLLPLGWWDLADAPELRSQVVSQVASNSLAFRLVNDRQSRGCIGPLPNYGDTQKQKKRVFPSEIDVVKLVVRLTAASTYPPPPGEQEDAYLIGGNASEEMTVAFYGSPPSQLTVLTQTIKTSAGATAGAASVLTTSPSLAAAWQRGDILSNLVNCPRYVSEDDPPGAVSHPTGMTIGASSFKTYIGAMYGNVLLIVVVFVVYLLLTVCVAFFRTAYEIVHIYTETELSEGPEHHEGRVERQNEPTAPPPLDLIAVRVAVEEHRERNSLATRFVQAAALTRFPGYFIDVGVFYLIPILSNAIIVAVHYPNEVENWEPLHVWSAYAVVVFVCVMSGYTYWGFIRRAAECQFRPVPSATRKKWSLLRSFFSHHGEWIPKEPHSHVIERFAPAFHIVRPHLLFFGLPLDIVSCLAAGLIAAQAPTSRLQCEAAFIGALITLSVIVITTALFRPYIIPFMNVMLLSVTVGQVLVVVFAYLAFLDGATNNDAYYMSIALWCDTVNSGFTMIWAAMIVIQAILRLLSRMRDDDE